MVLGFGREDVLLPEGGGLRGGEVGLGVVVGLVEADEVRDVADAEGAEELEREEWSASCYSL